MRSNKYDFSSDINAIAMENSPCNIFFIDEFGKIFHTNHTACDQLGYAYEKLTEMHIWDIDTFALNSYEKYLHLFENIQKSKLLPTVNSFFAKVNTEQFPVEIHAKSYKNLGTTHYLIYAFDRTKEFELKNEQEIYTNMLSFVNEFIFIVNIVNNKILFANETACKISGYTKDELKNMYITDIKRPFNEKDKYYETVTYMDKQDDVISYDLFLTKKGEKVPVETSSQIKKTNHNYYKLIMLKSIPERLEYIHNERILTKKLENYNTNLQNEVKKRTRELNETNERLSLAVESSSDGFWDWDIKTNKIFFSPVWKGILGYKENELDNSFSTWKKLVVTEQKRASWQLFNEFIKNSDSSIKLNFDMRHKDGHFLPVECRIKKILDENRHAIRLIGTYTDMSKVIEVKKQEKLIQEKLVESEKTLDAIFNFSKTGLLLINNKRIILKINDYLLKKLGYDNAYELIGQSTKIFYANKDIYEKFGEETYKKVVDGTIDRLAFLACKKDGSTIDFELRGNMLPNNNFLWTVSIFEDNKEETSLEKTK